MLRRCVKKSIEVKYVRVFETMQVTREIEYDLN